MKSFKEIINEIDADTNKVSGFKVLNNKEITLFLYNENSLSKNNNIYFNKNRFHYFANDDDLNGWNAMPFMWFTWWLDGKIVGIAKIGQYPNDGEHGASLNYIDVDSKYQHQGIATKLMTEVFKYFKEKNWTFRTSFYSEKGLKYVKPLFNKLAEKYAVDFIDRDERHDEILKKYSN